MIDTRAVVAARLTGQRRAFLSYLSDGDAEDVTAHRAGVLIGSDGVIDWGSSPLAGSVVAYRRAEAALGGAA